MNDVLPNTAFDLTPYPLLAGKVPSMMLGAAQRQHSADSKEPAMRRAGVDAQ